MKVTCPTCKKVLSVSRPGEEYCYYCLTRFTINKNYKLEHVIPNNFIGKISRTLTLYFLNTKFYSTSRIIFEFTLVPFPVKMIIGYLLFMLGASQHMIMLNVNKFVLFPSPFIIIFFVPFVETFIGQAFPIWFASKISNSRLFQVIFSAILFSGLHFLNSPIHPIVIFPVAAFLAWGYILLNRRSFLTGYFGTYAMHAMHNAIVVFISMAFFQSQQIQMNENDLQEIIKAIKDAAQRN